VAPAPYQWPETATALEAEQESIAAAAALAEPWHPSPDRPLLVAATFIAYRRGIVGMGARGDPAWIAAVAFQGKRMVASLTLRGQAGAPYQPGLLALREGALVEVALRCLPLTPEVALVDATGLDHPRRAGLALHVGAVLGLPTIGVTDRPLLAAAGAGHQARRDDLGRTPFPDASQGAWAPLMRDGELVGYLLRTRRSVKPLVVHAGWRTTPEVARDVALSLTAGSRTPEPMRQARRLARVARSRERGDTMP
jgi:deoxyribonuclease V